MTKEEIEESAKNIACSYFDNYCGTGFVFHWQNLVDGLSKNKVDQEVAYALMNGFLAGMAESETYHRQKINYRASPIESIEYRINNKSAS